MKVTVKSPTALTTTEGDLPAVVRNKWGPLQLVLADTDNEWLFAILTLTPTEALDLIDRLSAALGHGREVQASSGGADPPGPDDDTITLEEPPAPPDVVSMHCYRCSGAGYFRVEHEQGVDTVACPDCGGPGRIIMPAWPARPQCACLGAGCSECAR